MLGLLTRSSFSRLVRVCSSTVLSSVRSSQIPFPRAQTLCTPIRTFSGLPFQCYYKPTLPTLNFNSFNVNTTSQIRGLKTARRQLKSNKPKKYKLKTRKAVASRFKRLGGGGIKFWRCKRKHNSLSISKKSRNQKRRPNYAKGALLKKINKALINR